MSRNDTKALTKKKAQKAEIIKEINHFPISDLEKIMQIPTHANSKYTPKRVSHILNNISQLYFKSASIASSDIDVNTFDRWMKKYIELQSLVKKARGLWESSNLATIKQASKRSWQSAAWLLERIEKNKFASTQNIRINQSFDGLEERELDKIAATELESRGWTCIAPDND